MDELFVVNQKLRSTSSTTKDDTHLSVPYLGITMTVNDVVIPDFREKNQVLNTCVRSRSSFHTCRQ
jgi:hypothetical protein